MSNPTPLTPAVFYILLALFNSERHGYDIMRQVDADSQGAVAMGPGTLYGSIDRMIEAELVARSAKVSDDRRRIYYKLTDAGRSALNAEIARLSSAVKIAHRRKLQHA